jgi:CHAT domain-containing protein
MTTHGKMDYSGPMNLQLLLARETSQDPTALSSLDQPFYDGDITAGKVMSTRKLDFELVAMMACPSGIGRNDAGVAFIGCAQAFFLAGARRNVLGLWAVDARATSMLATRFYLNWPGGREGLASPMPGAESLSEAISWLRGLTSQEIIVVSVRLPRGEPCKRQGKPVAGHPYDHPRYRAAFIEMGDPS